MLAREQRLALQIPHIQAPQIIGRTFAGSSPAASIPAHLASGFIEINWQFEVFSNRAPCRLGKPIIRAR
jgi:hypothetical protein